jgi:hypothetical protein
MALQKSIGKRDCHRPEIEGRHSRKSIDSLDIQLSPSLAADSDFRRNNPLECKFQKTVNLRWPASADRRPSTLRGSNTGQASLIIVVCVTVLSTATIRKTFPISRVLTSQSCRSARKEVPSAHSHRSTQSIRTHRPSRQNRIRLFSRWDLVFA